MTAGALSIIQMIEVESRSIIHHRGSSFSETFTHVAVASGITVLKTSYRAPKANPIYKRFMGSLKRKHHTVVEYMAYFNRARPHQGIGQRIPESEAIPAAESASSGRIVARPILGGLHHDYHRAA